MPLRDNAVDVIAEAEAVEETLFDAFATAAVVFVSNAPETHPTLPLAVTLNHVTLPTFLEADTLTVVPFLANVTIL